MSYVHGPNGDDGNAGKDRNGIPFASRNFSMGLTQPHTRTCSADGLSEMTSDASRSAREAFCSPSAAITCKMEKEKGRKGLNGR